MTDESADSALRTIPVIFYLPFANTRLTAQEVLDMTKNVISSAISGHPLVLISVVSSEGSTPRSAGAMMTADTSGLLAGTIGGGVLEGQCLKEAASFLRGLQNSSTTRPAGFLRSFALDNSQAGNLGMICGGSTSVLFTPIMPSDQETFQTALAHMQAGEDCFLLLPLDGFAPLCRRQPGDGALSSSKACLCSTDNRTCLCIPLTAPGRVFLFGGGHVSLELSQLLDRLEFPYIVIDDRTEFAGRDRFPGALETFVLPFKSDLLSKKLSGSLAPRKTDAFCIMTRGHEGDETAVRFALSTAASYIGVMGSRKKREALFSKLEKEGFPQVRNRVTTPIGLSIKAQTPAEIAVSVAAQLIAWRADLS